MKVFLWTLGIAAAAAGVGAGVYYYFRNSPKALQPLLVDPGVPRLVKGPPPSTSLWLPEQQALATTNAQALYDSLMGNKFVGGREKRTTPLTPAELAAQQANNQPPPNGGSGFWGSLGDIANVGVDVLPVALAAV